MNVGGHRAVFWFEVGCVAILANVALELVALRVPSLGLRKFVAFSHLGGAGDLASAGPQQ